MGERVLSHLMRGLESLRYEPTGKRVRAWLGGDVAVDSTGAVLLWEPRRVVPSYAVPESDIAAEVVTTGAAATAADSSAGVRIPAVSDRPVLDPTVPFSVHTAEGEPVEVRAGGVTALGFRLRDPDLPGYVVLDFPGFEEWRDEDEPLLAHPRDPFHRIDVLPSSRHVRVELDGALLAESRHPMLLFETALPVRYYLPRDDVRVDLDPSDRRSWCAYKGQASYWCPLVDGRPLGDLAWSYEDPLHEAERVRGLVAFFDERVDVTVDGVRLPRPVTPWS
jgi:uncharacterized protein (DUF427 family)